MNNCYNTGLSQAAATTAAMHPLIGNGGNEGNYNNNYYLEGDQSEISSNSTAKSDEYITILKTVWLKRASMKPSMPMSTSSI